MTILVHKLLDALHHRGGQTIECVPSLESTVVLGELQQELAAAEKFDFETLPLEIDDPNPELAARGLRGGNFHLPKLTDDELEMWNAGLLPLPAPACWYEFSINGSDCRTGMYVRETAGSWVVTLVDYARSAPGIPPRFAMSGLVLKITQGQFTPETGLPVAATGPKPLIEYLKRDPVVFKSWCASAYLSIYLTLMLLSRTTEKRSEPVNEKLSKARVRRGTSPLYPFRVVNIVPARFRTGDGDGTHASPRLHWRRSHLRRFDHPTPSAKWCTHLGCYAVVVPRHLVGRAELGEVSHEYRIGGEHADRSSAASIAVR